MHSTSNKGLRVYEYVNQNGLRFWSFDKLPSVVTHSHTLSFEDRVGTHFDNYLNELRILRRYLLEGGLSKSEPTEEVPEVR